MNSLKKLRKEERAVFCKAYGHLIQVNRNRFCRTKLFTNITV